MAEHVTFWFGPAPWGPAFADEEEEEERYTVELPSPLFPAGATAERSWRPPRVRAVEIPTPVGELCMACHEAVEEGDSGEMAVLITGTPAAPVGQFLPLHRECGLLRAVGHEFGLCNCTNYEGLTRREAAIECAKRHSRLGSFGRYGLNN